MKPVSEHLVSFFTVCCVEMTFCGVRVAPCKNVHHVDVFKDTSTSQIRELAVKMSNIHRTLSLSSTFLHLLSFILLNNVPDVKRKKRENVLSGADVVLITKY